MKIRSSIKRTMAAPVSSLSVLLLVATAQTSEGVIVVHFVEEGPDVRVSFSGSIAVDPSLTSEMQNGFVSFTQLSTRVVYSLNSSFSYQNLGSSSESGIPFLTADLALIDIGGTFGFSFNFLYWSDENISGGDVGAVTELTAFPESDFFILRGFSLAALNADAESISEGATLWTATTTNDTFVFSRIAPVPVPEPSSLLLSGLGLLGLLRRRR